MPHKTFWDKTAQLYDRFMQRDNAAYDELTALALPVIHGQTVLELAAGTGAISVRMTAAAAQVEATDASPAMIEQAKWLHSAENLHFSVQDMFHLPYPDHSFAVVVVVNALHIIPHPEQALAEIARVLAPDGVLIAPTFTHAGNSLRGRIRSAFLRLAGFPLCSRWSHEEYLTFLRKNGWHVRKTALLSASFPLTYAECTKEGLACPNRQPNSNARL